jgi:NAD(P)-dependent dehydrogenase (short-subunit alcohol dehydrogenase family)
MTIAEYDLTGRVAFVTGAGRGIGKGIAQALAEAGADVVINSLTDRYVTALAADIGRATGRRVLPLVADVTRSEQVERAVDRVLAEFGALHILVNNLGDSIRKPLAPLPGPGSGAGTPLTDEELRFILDVNLTATLLCSRAVGPHMLARRSGKVGLWTGALLTGGLGRPSAAGLGLFVLAGLVGTVGGRLLRFVSIEKVGASIAAALINLTPLIAAGLAILWLGERVTAPILAGTLVIVLGTILLSAGGRRVGVRPVQLALPVLSATCFGVVAILRKLGLGTVSVVAPLTGTAPIFVLGLSYFFLRGIERLSGRAVVGTLLIVLGVFLITGLSGPWPARAGQAGPAC